MRTHGGPSGCVHAQRTRSKCAKRLGLIHPLVKMHERRHSLPNNLELRDDCTHKSNSVALN